MCIAGASPSSERQPAVPRLLPLPQQRPGLGAQRDREAGIPDPRVQVLLPWEGSQHVPVPASECAVRAQELTEDRSGTVSWLRGHYLVGMWGEYLNQLHLNK